MANINACISNYEAKSYADSGNCSCLIDCSLGVNKQAIPKSVLAAVSKIPADDVKFYPHDETIIDNIVKKFTLAQIKHENVWIGNGSYDLLCNLNIMYAGAGKTVFSYAPQFSAYVDQVHCIGSRYEYYALDKKVNYKFDVNAFIEKMKESSATLVCVENPNNPTGQIIALEDIEKIVAVALRENKEVIVDEAYGDYMALSNSAICLVKSYDNLFVTRSFSKGYGLAGIRMGYTVGAPEAILQLQKLVSPFNCSSFARYVANQIIGNKNFAEQLLEKTRVQKQLLLQVIVKLKNITVAATSLTTPIMLLYCKNAEIQLHDVLQEVGINSVSGLAYDNLGQNAVRMMLCTDQKLLIELLQKADALITAKRG